MIPYLKKIENKLGETSAHLFKTFFVYGFIALSMVVIKILISRFYGQAALGIFTYFFSAASLIFLFASFGFPEAITQTIIKKPRMLKSALKVSLPYMIISSIIVMSFLYFIASKRDVTYFGPTILLHLITYTFFYLSYSIYKGRKKFVEGSFYSLISRLLFIIFIVILPFLSKIFFYVLLSVSLALFMAALISIPRILKLFKKIPQNIKVDGKKFFYLAFSLFLMQVGFYSLRFLSEIIIGYLVDFNSLGLYSANSSIANVIRLVAYVFPVVVLPMAVISKYKLKHSLKKILKILIPFSFVVLILTYFLVPLFYGSQYKTTYLPIALVISSTLLVIYAYFNSVFVGENKFSKFYLKIIGFDLFLSLVVNTSLNIYFIIKIGIIGAPIATAITIILKIILNSYGIRKLRLKNRQAETI